MSILRSRPALRWLVPATAAAAVIGGGVAVGTLASASEPDLPPRSAAQLLVDLQTARLDGLSGTVVQRAELGLPDIANLAGMSGEPLAALISGKNTLRVWYAGPDQARIALMSTLGEQDMIRNGDDVWVWNSRTKEANHLTLPEDVADKSPTAVPNVPATPQEAADMALKAIDPSTEVTVDRTSTVAGRDAYQLVLSPRDKASLVGRITIAIDATEHVPLRFQVFPKGADDVAFEAAFTQISFDRPDPAQFTFNPPPGTKVTEEKPSADEKAVPAKPEGTPNAPEAEPTIVGEGWTSVVVAKTGGGLGDAAASKNPEAQQLTGMLDALPKVSGAWGSGRLLQGKLFSVLLTDDGRVLGGFVAPERLYEVAGTTR